MTAPSPPMASCSSSFASAFPSKSLVKWKGFEVWERSRTWTFASGASNSASLAAPDNLRSAAKRMARSTSVSYHKSNDLSSTFWGGESFKWRRPSSVGLESRSPMSMPIVEARLFGPSIFNASKLSVLLLGKKDEEKPLQQPRIYTLTHSDITAKITLAVAREINKAQVMGWYSQLQRDEVVAEWRRTQGEMSLHVHCHISGSNILHKLIAKLRFYIFQKELPLVLEAFMHGDKELFDKHPELQNAQVWMYFDSNVEEYNRVERWGTLLEATKRGGVHAEEDSIDDSIALKVLLEGKCEQQYFPGAVCLDPCECCSRHPAVIDIPESLNRLILVQCPQQDGSK